MRSLRRMIIILHIKVLAAVLSNEDIARSFEWERDGFVVRRGGALDMRIGRAARASGFMSGVRYYIPEIKTAAQATWDGNNTLAWRRDYDQDRALVDRKAEGLLSSKEEEVIKYKERYYQTVVYMYPSAGGLLNIATGVRDSLQKFLKTNDAKDPAEKKSPRILAALMAMALGAKLEGDARSNKPSTAKKNWGVNVVTIKHGDMIDISFNAKKLPKLGSIVYFFRDETVCGYDCQDSETFLLSKEALLHAFMHDYFDDYSDAHAFIGAFYEITKNDCRIRSQCFVKKGEAGNDDSRAVAAVYKIITDPDILGIRKTLPFTYNAPQLSSGWSSFYLRDKKKFLPNTEFSDCVEAALLSSLFYLFFDTFLQRCVPGESCELLKETDLGRLFEKYSVPEEANEKMKIEWLQLVEDLDDNSIVYCYHEKDEKRHTHGCGLCTGFINLLRVIVKITGLNASRYLSEFSVYDEEPTQDEQGRIIEAFKSQFSEVISKLCSKEVRITYPYGLRMKRIWGGDNWDILGAARFTMRDEEGRTGIFTMVHTFRHMHLEVTSEVLNIPENKWQSLNGHIAELKSSLESQLESHLLLAITYFLRAINPESEMNRVASERALRKREYLSFVATIPMQNDVLKIRALNAIFRYILLGGESRAEQLAENILNGLALGEDAVFCSVHPLVAFNSRFREKYAPLLEKYAVSFRNISPDQLRWIRDDDIRRQCIVSFHNKPELYMYMDGFEIANCLVSHGMEECMRTAVKKIPDAFMRSLTHACGFMIACEKEDIWLAEYFFNNLEFIDNVVLCARGLYLEWRRKLENLDFISEFLLYQARTTSDCRAIEKVYNWCVGPDRAALYTRTLLSLIRMTHARTGMELVVDRVLQIQDCMQISDYAGSLYFFYTELLDWMRNKHLPIREDVAHQVKDYIVLMGHESYVKGSEYFKDRSAKEVEMFRAELKSLEDVLNALI